MVLVDGDRKFIRKVSPEEIVLKNREELLAEVEEFVKSVTHDPNMPDPPTWQTLSILSYANVIVCAIKCARPPKAPAVRYPKEIEKMHGARPAANVRRVYGYTRRGQFHDGWKK